MVRVLPAVAGIDKEFDYLVPDHLDEAVRVGSVVRVDLAGRRVAAWVSADGVAGGDRPLRPLALVTGWGPEPSVVDLAAWAGWRWAGRRAALLSTAGADVAVRHLPPPALAPPARPDPASVPESLNAALIASGGPIALRLPPASDPTAVIARLAQLGPTLVVVPSVDRAAVLAGRLRRAGAGVALLPSQWPQARAGAGVVIGARGAAWGPCPGLAATVVVDGHDEGLVQEQAPTWGAVDVVVERSRRAGVPCVVISPCPSLQLLAGATLAEVPPDVERGGWSVLDVVDRRHDDPRLGLYSRRVVDAVRTGGTVLCVLNRVGRAKLLACGACGTLADCERCGAALGAVTTDELICPRCGLTRPVVCRSCFSTHLRQLRIGVSRAREELEVLAGRPVGEVTAAGVLDGGAEVLVGTEAVLHRVARADTVVFLDFDQHLLAARYRADEQAMGLLARASRLTGGRRSRSGRPAGRVVVQTRLPDHPVLAAAAVADPGRLAAHESPIRRKLRFPPFSALAAVSGPAAGAFVDRLRSAAAGSATVLDPPAIEVLGSDQGRWLLRAPDSDALADALSRVSRPPGRLRVEVDPLRV